MKVLVFDIKAPLGHFRRPDSTATHLTYPFITRTAIQGMIGSILGMKEFSGNAWVGVQLLNPVKTASQELSLLGKGFLASGGTFNRQTAVEFVVNPHYRIFYHGDYYDEIKHFIKQNKSTYHTYMGSAFALTYPIYKGELEAVEEKSGILKCITVVPTFVIDELIVESDMQYSRAGGIQYEYLGDRKFKGTINFIYEIEGKPITFRKILDVNKKYGIKIFKYKDPECICLW